MKILLSENGLTHSITLKEKKKRIKIHPNTSRVDGNSEKVRCAKFLSHVIRLTQSCMLEELLCIYQQR